MEGVRDPKILLGQLSRPLTFFRNFLLDEGVVKISTVKESYQLELDPQMSTGLSYIYLNLPLL